MRTPTFSTTHRTHLVVRTLAAGLGLALIASLAACGRPASNLTDLEAHAAAARPDADELLSAMLSPSGPTTAQDTLARLPEPISTTSRTVVSVHGGWATLTTLGYDGLEVTTLVPGEALPPLLVAVTLTSGSAPNHGLAIGMEAGQATEHFATARALPASPGATASFSVEDAPLTAPYQVDLSVEGGVLQAVTWSAYLD